MRHATAAAVTSPNVSATALLSATEPMIIPAIPPTHTTMTAPRTAPGVTETSSRAPPPPLRRASHGSCSRAGFLAQLAQGGRERGAQAAGRVGPQMGDQALALSVALLHG